MPSGIWGGQHLSLTGRTAGTSSTAWLRRNSFQKSWRVLSLLSYGFFYVCIFLLFSFFLTLGCTHGICGTNWKQNFWYSIQSAFSQLLASSEGLEPSPTCGQYKLQLHFRIRTKHGFQLALSAPGKTGYTAFTPTLLWLPLSYFWATWKQLPARVHTGTHTHTHRGMHKYPCLFSVGKIVYSTSGNEESAGTTGSVWKWMSWTPFQCKAVAKAAQLSSPSIYCCVCCWFGKQTNVYWRKAI